MKQKKQLLILTGMLAASIVLYGGVSLGVSMNEKKLQAEAESRAAVQKAQELQLVDAAEQDITSIRWTTGDGVDTEMNRTESGWTYTGDAAFPVLKSAVDEFAGKISRFTTTRKVETTEALAEYQLEPAEQVITVSLADGSSHTLKIGATSNTVGQCYVMLDDRSDVYLAKTDIKEQAQKELLSYIHKESIPTILAPTEFELTRKDGTKFTMTQPADPLKYTYTDFYNWFIKNGSNLKPANRNLAKKLVSGVQQADFVACVSYAADDAVLDGFGLKKPEITAAVSDGSVTNTLLIGDAFSRDGVDYRYVCLKDSDMVYALKQDDAELFFTANQDSMRQTDVMHLKWEIVTSIDAEYEDVTRHIEIEPLENDPQGRKYRFTENGKELDYEKIVNIKELIDKTTTLGMPEGNLEPGEQIIRLTFHQNRGNPDQVELQLKRYNDGRAYASLNGEPGVLCSIIAADNLVNFFKNVY